VARIQDVFDRTMPGWRERVAWARGHIAVDATGAVDHPGTTWRDRPAIDQGEDRFLAGDAVAAPGLLSEVSVNSAVDAARAAVDARIRRAFPVGWPTAELSPERRLAILAAAVPGAALRTRDGAELEPVDATGIGYRLVRRAGVVTGRTSASGGQVTTFASPGFLARVVGRRRRHR
jgi:hypothetical protein